MRQRTRVKFCGITRQADAALAVQLGADALGFVFHPKSPRYIAPALAGEIIAGLPPFVTSVGLVVDHSQDDVEEIVSQTKIDLIQFHGDESPEFCAQSSRPYIKAVRVKQTTDIQVVCDNYRFARGLLLDAYVAGVPGGSGERFDWSKVPTDTAMPIIMAGGLNPENVTEAIERYRPWGVDVSSGIEATPGIKEAAKMKNFIAMVKQVDGQHGRTYGN